MNILSRTTGKQATSGFVPCLVIGTAYDAGDRQVWDLNTVLQDNGRTLQPLSQAYDSQLAAEAYLDGLLDGIKDH